MRAPSPLDHSTTSFSSSSSSSSQPPLLPPINISGRSAVDSFQAATSSATLRGMENFHALQAAMYETYSALPPDAQMALLLRAPPGTAAPIPSSPSPSSPTSTSASTSYLASRESSLGRSAPTLLPQRTSPHRPFDARTRAPAPIPTQTSHSHTPHSHSPSPSHQPTPIHRVYVIRCASCDTFLSDRGMRAVLLLKPNIVLFSTDATPSNSGPIWPDAQQLDEPPPERTCDCLTSSLGCHGCGAVVGYHIVQPCVRCTASVQKHQRSANHHRYVFHHNEVVSSERQYYPDECGITGFRYVPPSRSSSSTSSTPTSSPVPPSTTFSTSRDNNEFKDSSVSSTIRDRSNDSTLLRRSAVSEPAKLRVGDTIYWHNLVSGGERARPVDPETRPMRFVERPGR